MMETAAPFQAPAQKNLLPLADTFFASAIASGSLAHAYVLKGKNAAALYQLALNVAQVLNCSERTALPASSDTPTLGQLACGQCKDCRWTQQNAHPGVLTVSRYTYQVNDKQPRPDLLTADELEKMAQKSNWPTMIKTDQMGHLIYQLGLSSENTRVVIFTDAEELPAAFTSEVPAPCEWRSLEATQDRSFHIRPLQRNIFNANSVNRFLKTLEEPPPRTLFFFITETEEQLLETIVSRCQVIPCINPNEHQGSDTLPVEYQTFLADFTRQLDNKQDVYTLAGHFEDFFIQQQGLNTLQALEVLQEYLRQQFLLSPHVDETSFALYRHRQQSIHTALRMIASKTHEGSSLLHLFLAL